MRRHPARARRLIGYVARSSRTSSRRRRTELARAVKRAPSVLFLDEPTARLDQQSRSRLWHELRRLRDQGTTVFVATNDVDEADALCDRVAIIERGRIVAQATTPVPSPYARDVIPVDRPVPSTVDARGQLA